VIEAFGVLFWLGLGITLKPGSIIVAILISSREDSGRRGFAYFLGWLCGLLVLFIVPTLYLKDLLRLPASIAQEHVPRYDLFLAALGVILLLAAAVTVVWGPLPDDQIRESRWVRIIKSGNVLPIFGIGAFLSAVSLRNVVLMAAAGSVIDQSDFDPTELAIVVVIFMLIASLGILAPPLLQRFGGARAQTWLRTGGAWLTRHMAMFTGVIMALFGALLLTRGIQGLI
jgi:threonine/homoserine/homoserine lactone efflux protein